MNLYIWHEYARDYSSGIGFAVAYTVEEAREALKRIDGYHDDDLEREPEVRPLSDAPFAHYISGGG